MTVTIIVGPSAGYSRCFDKQLSIDEVESIAKEIEKIYTDRGNKVESSVLDDGEIEFEVNEKRIVRYYWAVVDTETYINPMDGS